MPETRKGRTGRVDAKKGEAMNKADINHLIAGLRQVVKLLRSNSPSHRHMAAAKLLADISALKQIAKSKP
jgi:hypothetical protein